MKIEKMSSKYDTCLSDESRYRGQAEYVSFPDNFQDVKETIKFASEHKLTIKVQGSRTGLAGAAVPEGGIIIDISKLNQFSMENNCVYAEAGVSLETIQTELIQTPFYFLPNPTEKTALLGGLYGCNAKGSNGVFFSKSVKKIWWMTGEGEILEIQRGQCIFNEEGVCVLPSGKSLVWKAEQKLNISKMDLIDFLAGKEGSLGIVLAFEFELSKKINNIWGVLYFFSSEDKALSFSDGLLNSSSRDLLTILDFFDQTALELLSDKKNTLQELKVLSDFPVNSKAAIYMEVESNDLDQLEIALFEQLNLFENLGGTESQTWAADELVIIERFRTLRHAIVTIANDFLDEQKVLFEDNKRMSFDFMELNDKFKDLYTDYKNDVSLIKTKSVIFGSCLYNDIHILFLPKDINEWLNCRSCLEKWINQLNLETGVLLMGVGQMKKELLENRFFSYEKEAINEIKDVLDPKRLLQ